MNRHECIILGVNHQFMYLESMHSPAIHEKTLKHLANNNQIDALDFWIPAVEPYRTKEIQILRNCNKYLNYNIGDRYGEKISCFAAVDPLQQQYARDIFKRESEMALAVGASKIIISSGPDFPDDRPAAVEALSEFFQYACSWLPKDIMLALEPTDRDMDKCFLIGPLNEAVDFVSKMHAGGCSQLSILLDMGHIPLLNETISSAIEKVISYLGHIHLGNCIICNPSNPLYGDKHVPWGIDQGEYKEQDVSLFLKSLHATGYFQEGIDRTVSIEMRPIAGLTPEESLRHFIKVFDQAWDELFLTQMSQG